MKAEAIRDWLVREIARTARIDPSAVDLRAPFDSYGLSSLDAVALSGDLVELLGRDLSPTLVYEHPSIDALSRYLGDPPAVAGQAAVSHPLPEALSRSVAIVGMSCRFPGADGPAELWRLLREGVDAIREVPPDRWDASAYYDADSSVPGKATTRWGGFLDQVDHFDPFFFGISPGEAERMDPQQRLLLELAYEAFEDAGCTMPRLAGSRTAVLVGISLNEYGLLQHGRHDLLNGHSGTGAALAIAANRISYFFDLHGPSMAVDTACSSSLMAVHLACQSLRRGECDLALAGGVNLILSPAHSIAFTKAGVLAPDGRCKPFDAGANGYVRGEGGGLVVLKPLARAISDGDRIHAVIRGGAVFQDGRTNGLMAPNRVAQEAVLRAAYEDAGAPPGEVQYVETHGTGTLLGDSMEARALGAVLSAGRTNGPCALGSIKSNLGHLEAAAGVAGLIKVALSLEHRGLPPSLHFRTPNPQVQFEALGLRVQGEFTAWPEHPGPALAGVSSFGFGGTNVHLVLEEAPRTADAAPGVDTGAVRLIPLSARSPEALIEVARQFRSLAAGAAPASLAELAATAALRRTHLDCRVAVIARSREELAERLDAFVRGEQHPEVVPGGDAVTGDRRIAFMFSGQGSQWPGMGSELLRSEPAFRTAFERCSDALLPELGWSLLQRMQNAVGADLEEIDVIQPALFAMQLALAALWQSWGIEPTVVVGHSMGEVAAAHVAGGLSLEDAARVIAVRSRLLKRLSGQGGMAVVGLSAEATAAQLSRHDNGLAIAASNGPRSTVVAGEMASLNSLIASLEGQGIFCRRVKVDVAAHGSQAAPLAEALRQALAGIRPRSSERTFLSAVTGSVTDTGSLGPEYWAANLIQPVNFFGAIREVLRHGDCDFIELSPHPLLQSSVQQSLLEMGRQGNVLASLRREEDERLVMLKSLATLYATGRDPAWDRISSGGARPVALPAYPWQRQRYWLEAQSNGHAPLAAGHSDAHPFLGRRFPLAREPETYIWQTELDGEREPFLSDHRVNGEMVLPGSVFIEMALAAAAECPRTEGALLRDVVFVKGLTLRPDARVTLQAVLAPVDGEAWSFTVYSRAEGTEPAEWTLHATATVAPVESDAGQRPTTTSLAALRAGCTGEAHPDTLYRSLADRGLGYGPAMRAITEVRYGTGEALGRISLPGTPHPGWERYQIHPVLLDAAFQTLAAVPDPSTSDPESGFMPAGCRTIRLWKKPGQTAWSHVVIRSAGATSGEIEADVSLFDEMGEPVAELTGFRVARVRRTSRPAVASGPRDLWLYRVQWQVASGHSTAPVASPQPAGSWLILADSQRLAQELERHLVLKGHRCRVVSFDQARTGQTTGPDTMGQLLEALIGAELTAETSPVRGIVSLLGSEPASSTAGEPPGCAAALALIRRLVGAAGVVGTPRLWLVTRGAQSVITGEPVVTAQAPLWGLGKSIGFELPQFQCTLVDLDLKSDVSDAAEHLADELLAADAEDQVALRGGRRLVARVTPFSLPASCPANGTSPIHEDATYLITGGLGGLGLSVCRWMIERGARQLVLAGRTPPSAPVSAALEEMRAGGATIVFEAADVSRREEVTRMIGRIRETMPPLRGVIHAAGVLDNSPVITLDPERLARVLAPKMAGGWNLHLATLEDDLDFFVLFSSAVSVLGSPGQGNYSAANSFLDMLAHQRQAEGRPAVSINWGPWEDVGLVADGNFIGSRPGAGDRGVKGIAPRRGLETLGAILAGEEPQVTVLPFDLRSLLELYPQAARIPLFAEVGGRETHVAGLYARPRLRQEYVAPRNEIEQRLAEMWRQTLRIDRVGVRDSFFELGGDSVLAAQLVSSAHRAFGVELDLRDAFKLFTIEHLATRLEAAMVARLDQMSESEAQRLLQER